MVSVSDIVLVIIISILLILLSASVPVATCTKRSISGKKVAPSSLNVNKLLKDKSALRQQKQTVKVTITHQNKKGDGYCNISTSKYHRKFIVPGALIGETVTATIEKETKSTILGKLNNVINPSLHRDIPKCSIAADCGGCQLQHQKYADQLKFKESGLKLALSVHPTTDKINILPIIENQNHFHYRNRAQFAIQKKSGKILVGLFATGTHDVVDTDECAIQHPKINDVLHICKTFFNENSNRLSIYDEKTESGSLRHLLLRASYATGEVMVCIVSASNSINDIDNVGSLVKKLRNCEGVKSILFHYNDEPSDNILNSDGNLKILHGKDYINDLIGDVRIRVSAHSFVQSNPLQAKIMYKVISELIPFPYSKYRLWDLYCGVGTIGLSLVSRAANIVGIEDCFPAFRDAKINADLNNATNIQFLHGKVENLLRGKETKVESRIDESQYFLNLGKEDIVIINPPRKGCEKKFLLHLVECGVQYLIYISCNPSTLARDLNLLIQKDYIVQKMQPIDMFPQSYHLETVVLLVKA